MNISVDRKDFARLRTLFRGERWPVSFMLGGKAVRGVPSEWKPAERREVEDANIVRRTVVGRDPGSGLRLSVTRWEYRDFPVVEWMAEFTNDGEIPSPILSEVKIGGETSGDFRAFVHGNGDTCGEDGYAWAADPLENGPLSIQPIDGTPCRGAFPYMKLVFGDSVLRAAVGWPHMWKVTAERSGEGVRYEAGQLRCHMRVLPGETVRTPRLTFLFSEGDEFRSMNLWRRWYFAHVLPRENGKPVPPLLCLHYWSCEGKPEHTAATEENQLRALQSYLDKGLVPDLWWIDAGWYKCDYNWPKTGTWKPDPERFPRGLGPIGEACDKIGARFLLWFEPERVTEGSELDTLHPEWLLPTGRDGNKLLNLGNPAAREWLTDRVDSLIKESHIRVYRQDFNFDPAPCWELAEAEDRIGALENLHAQGYYRYWDDLLDRNPGLLIDSCASGGRRNEIETMRRAFPLHYTDVGYGSHPVKQNQYRQMFEWIPYFRSQNMSWDREYVEGELGRTWIENDEFSFQTAMAPAVTYMTWWDAPDDQAERTKAAAKIWRRAAEIMLSGDYEPLTECRKDPGDWYAMRFETENRGFVQVLRNRAAEDESFTVKFRAEAGKTYVFEDVDGAQLTITGEEMLEKGFAVSLPKRTGKVLFYEVK